MKAKVGIGCGAALLVALALAASATATPSEVAGWGQGAGRVNGPQGVAVDQPSGDLYVADRNNFRVDRFGPEGNFLLAWGAGVADDEGPGLQACGPAAEPEPIKRCFAGLFGSEEAVVPYAVAVEPSSGDIYTAEPNGQRVSRFTPAGRFVLTLGRDVNKTKVAEEAPQAERDVCTAASGDLCGKGKAGTGPGEFEGPRSLAFDSAGGLWVNDNGGRLQRFDPGGGFLEEVPLPAGSERKALAIDPTSGDFYVLGPLGHDEGQKVEVPSTYNYEPGEYTLSFEGEETAESFSGSPSDEEAPRVQEALEELPAIGKHNVSVKAGFDYFDVSFIGGLGGRDVPQLVATTLSATPPVTVKTTQQGAPGSVRRLDSTGAPKEELDNSPGDLPQALATDAAGNLYVGDAGAPYHFLRYDPAGNLTSVFGTGRVLGSPEGNAIAVDEGSEEREAALYAASSTSAPTVEFHPGEKAKVAVQRFSLPAPGPLPSEARAEGVLPTEATLTATLNPEGKETGYSFQYLSEAAYEANLAESRPPFEGAVQTAEAILPGGYEEEGVSAEIEGLVPATAYRFRILAKNMDGETEAQATFATRTAVGVEAQWASALSAHEATLDARLDPLGVEATWWLEYDTSPYQAGEAPHGASVPLPHPALPAGFGEVPVTVALRGLEPATTYHYRFAARDERPAGTPYTTYGEDRRFTTQPAGLGLSLPDGRAWEMVSPPDKHGGRISAAEAVTGGQVQAAADGEALAYLSYGSLEAHPEGNRLIEQSSQLARRAAGGHWETTDITPPYAEASPVTNNSQVYKLFSTNLERALLDPHAPVDLSPYASEATPYVRENSRPPSYAPLAVGCPPEGEACPAAVREHEDVPAGTEFGGGLKVRGASPDLSHVVLKSEVPLVKGAAEQGLYEWSGGALEPLSALPEGEGGKVVGGELGGGEASTRGAVSGDGSRVFWSRGQGGVNGFTGLYMRDTAGGETVRLDDFERFGGFGTGKVDPLFQGASSDGSTAFFTDTQNLTEDASEEGADLYRWRAQGAGGCGQAGGCLEDLSAGVANFGESAEVLGVLPGIAEDGSRAFFVARGVLAGNTVENGAGPEAAAPGRPNLYAWSPGEGTRFVAGLAEEDSWDWGSPTTIGASAYALTAAASPSGRYLALMSDLPLTGYDNRALGSGERAQEVFRYDALTEGLACVSCNPSGGRPRALAPGAGAGQLPAEFDFQDLWSGTPVAAVVPEAPDLEFNPRLSAYRPRYVQDDGRVFFDAADSLVAADSNGNADVYEYEPNGTGSCGASAADSGTALVPGGCVSLISSGRAAGGAAFLDASEGGGDAFFYSPARLSVTDEDSELDVYDAREGGEPATAEPLAECLGEACQPPAAPPALQAPSSASFRGPGNLRAARHRRCPKGRHRARRHGKARCVRRSHARKHHHHKRRRGRRSR